MTIKDSIYHCSVAKEMLGFWVVIGNQTLFMP
jgi:hypothetical protein